MPGSRLGIVRENVEYPEQFSYTSLTEFSSCPTAWALHRIDGVKRTYARANAQAVGMATHAMLEQMTNGSTFDDAMSDAISEMSERGDVDLAEATSALTTLAKDATDWEVTNPYRSSILQTEVDIRSSIEGYKMVGRADTLEMDPDGIAVIGDYKTGQIPHPVEVTPEGERIYSAHVTRQPTIYAEMSEEKGIHIGRVRMYYPANRDYIEIDLDSERGQRLRIEARRFVTYTADRIRKSIRTGFFPARPKPKKCASCPVREACEFAILPDEQDEMPGSQLAQQPASQPASAPQPPSVRHAARV